MRLRFNPIFYSQINKFFNDLERNKINYKITSGLRTYHQQKKLYLNNPKDVAYPGTSFHESGRAVDLANIKIDRKFFQKPVFMAFLSKHISIQSIFISMIDTIKIILE